MQENYFVSCAGATIFKSWKHRAKVKVAFHECGWANTYFVLVMDENHVWHKVKIHTPVLDMFLFASFSKESDAQEFADRIS